MTDRLLEEFFRELIKWGFLIVGIPLICWLTLTSVLMCIRALYKRGSINNGKESSEEDIR